MFKNIVLGILKSRKGEFVSGESMSRALGVTRAGVWKAVKVLRSDGYVISSVTNRGYRLEGARDVLTKEEVHEYIKSQGIGKKLVFLDTVDSTNTYAMQLASRGGEHGCVVLASAQTAGRGRQGKRFISPKDKGVYMSIILRPDAPVREMETFTAFTAVAVCDAIEEVCGFRPGIKWTNDIMYGGKKLCGILTEISVEGESGMIRYMVVGIGINVSSVPEDFSDEVRAVAGSLETRAGKSVGRARLAADVINKMDRMYANMREERSYYLGKFRAGCITVGHNVKIVSGRTEKFAYAVGIDDSAALIVEYEDGSREALKSGEVSIRGIDGYV